MQQRGKTARKTQRWYCKNCRVSGVRSRSDVRWSRYRKAFIRWITGNKSLADIADELGITRRTLTRRFSQFLVNAPKLSLLDKTDETIILDAIWIGGRRAVVLIAKTPQRVLSWSFVGSESKEHWGAFVGSLPPPRHVVVDGHNALLAAISEHWPDTLIQRCDPCRALY